MIAYDFTGKVAFVTGAAAGMGAATARAFAQAGAAVAIVDRDIEAAERFATELTGEGLKAVGIGCDGGPQPRAMRRLRRSSAMAYRSLRTTAASRLSPLVRFAVSCSKRLLSR